MRKFLLSIIDAFFPQNTEERPSPKIRITPEKADTLIRLFKSVPGYESCYVAAISPTNSMEPGIDDGMYVILDPLPHTDLIVGDIIYYEMPEFRAIHRIIEIGADPEWYCICKGDNNGIKDSAKVRAYGIKGVWRATIN